ncbi:MAG: HlyD family secretion protein, partial [Pseudomonadota bacterium]
AYRRQRSAHVLAQPGAVIWSVSAAAGSTVAPGETITVWIDCNDLLVDVPVSDAELALLTRGMTADVLLEGEGRERQATVLLTRGSGAVLDRADLAAVAKGRQPGMGQLLLRLDLAEEDGTDCPVGRAAFVDLHDVGLLDVIAARLRLN